MAEVTNELIYEVLKGIQTRLERFDERFEDISEELIGIRTHMHASQGEINRIYTRLGAIETRIDRVEKRLEIITEPAD
ncbi:MAG: hypothetical protein AAGF28_07070 [Pseudomonadota bacterium]